MMTFTAAEIAYEASVQAMQNAKRAFDRRRTAAHRAQLVAAMEANTAALEVLNAARFAEERAERLAVIAARRSARADAAAAQPSLF
jgi:hypothetical protein